jgi:hypothetical protein
MYVRPFQPDKGLDQLRCVGWIDEMEYQSGTGRDVYVWMFRRRVRHDDQHQAADSLEGDAENLVHLWIFQQVPAQSGEGRSLQDFGGPNGGDYHGIVRNKRERKRLALWIRARFTCCLGLRFRIDLRDALRRYAAHGFEIIRENCRQNHC